MIKQDNEDMSMEEILASIRRYVSSTNTNQDDDNFEGEKEDTNIPEPQSQAKIVHLTEDMMEKKISSEQPKKLNKNNPFKKLNVFSSPASQSVKINSGTKMDDLTASELINAVAEKVIREWMENNLERIAENLVNEKIKQMSHDE